MIMRPGAYLALRRTAAGLTVEDVAARVGTDPQLKLRDRVEWLKRIEADVDPITISVAAALQKVFAFSPDVLVRLANLHDGASDRIEAPRLCHVCGCSEFDPCDDHGQGCAWAGPDICSCCIAAPARASAA